MDKNTLDSINTQIAIYKVKNGITFADIAAALNMTAFTLRCKREGKTMWTMPEIIDMCNLFKVSPEVLIGWDKS